MGTSSSFGGPKKATPLLPPWAIGVPGDNAPVNDETDTEPSNDPTIPENQPIPDATIAPIIPVTGTWRGPKSTIGRIASGRSTIQRAGLSYVRNLGGARKAASSAKAGRQAMISLGGFLSNLSGQGFESTLHDYGLSDCIGQPAHAVFARIVDRLAPPGSTIDEVHAREAILRALESIWERCEADGRDLATLDHLTAIDLREAILKGIAAFIYNRWLYETGLAIQSKEVDIEAVADVEQDAKDFVLSAVQHDFDRIDVISSDFNSPESSSRMNKIFESAYAFIEHQP